MTAILLQLGWSGADDNSAKLGIRAMLLGAIWGHTIAFLLSSRAKQYLKPSTGNNLLPVELFGVSIAFLFAGRAKQYLK